MKPIQISNGMFVAMIVNIIFAKAIGLTQGVLARYVGQDMWIATLLGALQGIVMMYMTYLVLRKTPERDFIELGAALLGSWFGKLIALILFVFFVAAFGPIMIAFVYHLKDYFLPETPAWIFITAALLVGALGCYYGLEVMARVALVGMLFIFLLNGLITIGSLGEFDIRNLLPVLERGFPQAVKASAYFDGDWALATMMAALVMPMVKDVKLRGHLGMVGMLASGLIIAIWSLLEGAVLSSEVTSQYTISCMKLARNAHIGNFLQRYEMIMIAFYSVSALFEIMFCVYGAAICASKLFGLRSHKPMIVPACILLGCFGYWVIKDHFHALHYLEHQWPYIALPIAFGLPLLLLALRMALGWRLDSAAK